MRPRKDYDDYTTFVNDTYADSKAKMFNMLSHSGNVSPAMKSSGKHMSIMREMKKNRLLNTSHTTRNDKAKKVEFGEAGDNLYQTHEVQPRILESRVSTR